MPGPNSNLDAFLHANAEAPETTTTTRLDTTASETPAPTPSPESAPKEAPAEPKPTPSPVPTPEPDDDPDLPEGDVPRQALMDERQKRRDWKGRADRAEAQLEELRKQMEELRKPQVPVAAPQQMPQVQFQFSDPQTNPAAYLQEQLMNHTFNLSEMSARHRMGNEAVDAMKAEFRKLADADPSGMLWHQIRMQQDPYSWAHTEVERRKLLADMGSDPNAYRAKLRAEIEAEMRAQAAPAPAAPTNTPAPAMPPSLANVRSAAGRAAPQWSGPPSDQQATADFRAYRMRQRTG